MESELRSIFFLQRLIFVKFSRSNFPGNQLSHSLLLEGSSTFLSPQEANEIYSNRNPQYVGAKTSNCKARAKAEGETFQLGGTYLLTSKRNRLGSRSRRIAFGTCVDPLIEATRLLQLI